MANFIDPPTGRRISTTTIDVPVGGTTLVGLWGFKDQSGKPLTIIAGPYVDVTLVSETGDTRIYQLFGKTLGQTTRVEAENSTGATWDWINAAIVQTPLQTLLSAAKSGKLAFQNGSDLRTLNDIDAGRSKVRLSNGVTNLLTTLLDAGQLGVLSLVRVGQGPHGEKDASGGVVCRAVDISSFRGAPVTLSDRGKAIDVVTSLLKNFPAGSYDLGFPRPVGGPTGFDASSDVFFSVPDVETAGRCYAGRIAVPLTTMLEPARSAVSTAMAHSAADFNLLYPDGLNHLHVKVLGD